MNKNNNNNNTKYIRLVTEKKTKSKLYTFIYVSTSIYFIIIINTVIIYKYKLHIPTCSSVLEMYTIIIIIVTMVAGNDANVHSTYRIILYALNVMHQPQCTQCILPSSATNILNKP